MGEDSRQYGANALGGMRAAVTGGCGFIGSHLVERLEAGGAEVVVIDDLSRGMNIPQRAALWEADLTKGCPVLHNFDVVFHLAAKVTGIEYNRFHHYDMLMTNLAITQNVVEAVRRGKPDLFVNVSTACVYPHDAKVPTPESAGELGNPEPTNYGYGVAKWAGEQMARFLHKEHGIPVITVRFFNAFGPRDYYDEETSHVAPAIIRRVLEGQDPVVVWGTGKQTRALVDARDIAEALARLTEAVRHGDLPLPRMLTLNIGHQREVSIRELAETIVRLSGKSPELVFDVTKPDGYARRAADTTLLNNLIGWVPDRPLEETLGDMVAEFERGEAVL